MAINTRKYHNQAGKRTIHCGLCRTAGHNRTSCPMIDEWAKEYEKWLNEHQGSAQGMPCAWRKRQAYTIYTKKKQKATAARAKPACGFCRSTDHNRRNCKTMEKWRKSLQKANTRWRRAYAAFATAVGCSPGSLLEITHKEYDYVKLEYVDRSNVVLVDNTLPENLSLFCAAEAWEIRQEYNVPVVGSEIAMSSGVPVSWFAIGRTASEVARAHKLFISARFRSYESSNNTNPVRVLRSSDYEFTEEWINQQPADIDFMLKKMTLERLINYRLDALIDKWQ